MKTKNPFALSQALFRLQQRFSEAGYKGKALALRMGQLTEEEISAEIAKSLPPPEKPALARIAIPAHFYIAVPMTDDSTDEDLIAAAKKRISEVLGEYAIECEQFPDADSACVYLDEDNEHNKATVEDRYW